MNRFLVVLKFKREKEYSSGNFKTIRFIICKLMEYIWLPTVAGSFLIFRFLKVKLPAKEVKNRKVLACHLEPQDLFTDYDFSFFLSSGRQ